MGEPDGAAPGTVARDSDESVQGNDTRDRLVAATLRCIEARGMASTTLADVAREAGISRATLYRHVPGGRSELISAAVLAEATRFIDGIDSVMDGDDVVASLAAGLAVGNRSLKEHVLLQQVLSTEPGPLLAELYSSEPQLHDVIAARVRALLEREELREGTDLEEATSYIAGMFLAYMGSQGRWDLSDPAQVRRLVRTQFLAGVLASV